LRAALGFLLPLGGPIPEAPGLWRQAIWWFVPIGLLIGLGWALTYRAAWHLFGEVVAGVRFMPATTVWLLDTAFFGSMLAVAVARVAHAWTSRQRAGGEPSTADDASAIGVLALVAVLVVKWAMLVSLPMGMPWWPSDWRRWFNFAYPRPIYRPLLLAPLWGRWAILLAAGIGRTARSCDPATTSLCRAMRPSFTLTALLGPMFLSAVYCSRQGNRLIGVVLGLMVLGISFAGAVTLARKFGGQTRWTLLAAGQLAELAFLACYLGLRPYILGW